MFAPPRFVGTAGWNIPRAHRDRFPAGGPQLPRYAARLNAAEINTSFYRPHAASTYARWAALVPSTFRFAVKVPKAITHDRELLRTRKPLERFLVDTAGLGATLGPLLVQLPPSLAFDSRRAGRFFDLLRSLHTGPAVCEPRHATWAAPGADRLLDSFHVARVAADPPRGAFAEPGGWRGLAYYRWHGSPRMYFSSYPPRDLNRLAAAVRASGVETWSIFDNTGSGSAAGNALDLVTAIDRQRPLESSDGR